MELKIEGLSEKFLKDLDISSKKWIQWALEAGYDQSITTDKKSVNENRIKTLLAIETGLKQYFGRTDYKYFDYVIRRIECLTDELETLGYNDQLEEIRNDCDLSAKVVNNLFEIAKAEADNVFVVRQPES